jgi:UDP:flavonoid glycosyltransferase YjiC (YdhE family)
VPALAGILGDQTYREKASGIAATMGELPDVASAVSLLEQLAGS